MARMVDRTSTSFAVELVAGQAGDEGQRVDARRSGPWPECRCCGSPPSSTPKARLAPMMKPSGFQAHLPIGSPSSVSTTSASKMMNSAQGGQQDAQHQREVARPHAGALADVVGGGAPGEGDADDHEHEAGEKVLLTLDFHVLSPRKTFRCERLWSQCPSAAVVGSTYKAQARDPSLLHSSGGVAVSTSSSVVSPSATRSAPASRSGRMPSATACRRSASMVGCLGHLFLEGLAHRQQLVQAHAAHEARHAAIDAAHRLVGLVAAADLPGLDDSRPAPRA